MRYLDPKNDLTFKKIFGEHPDLLKSLLNALIPLKEDQVIEELEYLPSEMVPAIPGLKDSIVDVRCKDNHGQQFIVEMQMLWTESFKARVLFNASKAFVKQLDKGRKYESLQPVYALSLVNESYSEYKDKFYHHYSIVDIEDTKQRLEGLEFVFIELPKFKPQNIKEKKMMVLWLRFLTEIEDGSEQIPEELEKNREIKKALEILQESAFSKAELETYDRYWDAVSTERTLLSERTRLADKQGFERGMQRGMQQGMQQGIEQTTILKNETVILNGYKNNIPIETLALLVSLTVEEVKNILRKHKLLKD